MHKRPHYVILYSLSVEHKGLKRGLRPSYMINEEHSRQKAPTSDTFEPMCSISHGFNLFVLMATVENVGGFSRREAVGGGGRWCLAVLRGASRPQSPPQSPPTSPPTPPPAVREAFLSGSREIMPHILSASSLVNHL